MSFDKLNRFKPHVLQRKPSEKIIIPNVMSSEGMSENNDKILIQQEQNCINEDEFGEPDSDKNIIFIEQNGSSQIKCATIYKLIERIITEKQIDPNFMQDFLLTFRSFTTPIQLFTLLIKRYYMPVPKNLSYGELQEWKQNILKPVRLRLINFIKTWLEKYWKDFIDDNEMTEKFHDFLLQDVSTTHQNLAEMLSKIWDKKKSNPDQDTKYTFGNEEIPKPILPQLKGESLSSVPKLSLLDFHSEELARQLTLIEFNLYKNMKPWEFFNQAWSKSSKEIDSPNVLKMIKRFNVVSLWVSTEIVKTENLKDRIGVLCKFLELADKCRSLNNFNGVLEIISGLSASCVFRLKQTWNGLSGKQKDLFQDLKEMVARDQNYAKLRKHIKECNPPIIPYLGFYLTDLIFIEDGNPNLIEGGLINWFKRKCLAQVIKEIQQYQQKPYCFEEVHFIQDYLLNYIPLDENEAYNVSLLRENRN